MMEPIFWASAIVGIVAVIAVALNYFASPRRDGKSQDLYD